jgi:hypothetical protein
MRASKLMVAISSEERGMVVLTTNTASNIHVIGASVPLTVTAATQVHSFGICPEKNKEGVVAVSICFNDRKSYQWLTFMLPVIWRSGKPFVDLENVWTPSADRIGQAVHHHIEICIDGQWFATETLLNKKARRYMPDVTLALRYLVGDATAEEVVTAAEEVEKEALAQEQLKEAQEELVLLREQKESLKRLCEELRDSSKDLSN